MVTWVPHFIRLLIIKTIFCLNLNSGSSELDSSHAPGAVRSWPQVTRFVTIVTMSWTSMTQRDTGDWADQWPLTVSVSLTPHVIWKRKLLDSDLILIPFSFGWNPYPDVFKLPPYLVKRGKCVTVLRNYDGRAGGKNKSLRVIGIVILAKTTLILFPASSVFLLLRKKVLEPAVIKNTVSGDW